MSKQGTEITLPPDHTKMVTEKAQRIYSRWMEEYQKEISVVQEMAKTMPEGESVSNLVVQIIEAYNSAAAALHHDLTKLSRDFGLDEINVFVRRDDEEASDVPL